MLGHFSLGAPRNAATAVPAKATAGSAAHIDNWKQALEEVEQGIEDVLDLGSWMTEGDRAWFESEGIELPERLKATIIYASDHQEFNAYRKELEAKLAKLVATRRAVESAIEQLERKRNRNGGQEQELSELKQEVERLSGAARKTLQQRLYLLGALHIGFGALRGIDNMHSALCWRGIAFHAGFGASYEYIANCKSGWSEAGRGLLRAAQRAFGIVSLCALHLTTDAVTTVANYEEQREALAKKSVTFRVYHRFLGKHAAAVLDLHESTRGSGVGCAQLQVSALKRLAQVFATSGNCLFHYAILCELRARLTAKQADADAAYNNPSAECREKVSPPRSRHHPPTDFVERQLVGWLLINSLIGWLFAPSIRTLAPHSRFALPVRTRYMPRAFSSACRGRTTVSMS